MPAQRYHFYHPSYRQRLHGDTPPLPAQETKRLVPLREDENTAAVRPVHSGLCAAGSGGAELLFPASW